MPPTQGEVVHAEHPWPPAQVRLGQRAQESEQGVRARRDSERHRRTGTGPARERQGHGFEHRPEKNAAAPVAVGEAADLLGERASWTGVGGTAEPADPQPEDHRASPDRGVGHAAAVPIVHPPGPRTADKAAGLRTGGSTDHPDTASGIHDIVDGHPVQVREQLPKVTITQPTMIPFWLTHRHRVPKCGSEPNEEAIGNRSHPAPAADWSLSPHQSPRHTTET